MTEERECKIVPSSTMFRIRGNDKQYQEALQASSKFNKRLLNERKMRIPFIDSQTKVAQANCMIWHLEYERRRSNRSGYVYTYPVKQWFKNRRLNFENDNGMLPKLYHHPSLEQGQYSNNEASNNNNNNMMEFMMTGPQSQMNQNQFKQQQQPNDNHEHHIHHKPNQFNIGSHLHGGRPHKRFILIR